MCKLPGGLKLTRHAQIRLEERKDKDTYYDTKNIMRSSCKWYGKDDLIPYSELYRRCLYVCRKSKNKMRYLTDGNVEVLYNKADGVVITVMVLKEKFKPITKYIKTSVLEEIERKSYRNLQFYGRSN